MSEPLPWQYAFGATLGLFAVLAVIVLASWFDELRRR